MTVPPLLVQPALLHGECTRPLDAPICTKCGSTHIPYPKQLYYDEKAFNDSFERSDKGQVWTIYNYELEQKALL